MDGINKKYNIEIEVLTPLSIGAGQEKDWVRGVDFVVDNGKLYKLNLKKMVEKGINIDDITSCFATKNEEALKSKLVGKLDVVSDFSMPFPANTDNDVKAFVKNQLNGKPVLTGSSLKGAIRSVLFQYLKGNSKDGKEVFGSSTAGDEFMRFIKISDAEFDKTELVNTKIFNLQRKGDWIGGWKHAANQTNSNFNPTGFNTLYESLTAKQKGYASLMMSEKLYDLFETKQKTHLKSARKKPILQNDIQTLFGIINKHTKDYLEKEKAFFEKYATDRTKDIASSIELLLSQIPSDNSYCILKMSAGSGFHSITGDWQFDDYSHTGFWEQGRNAGKKKYKSRKIAEWGDNLSLMGFVKLRTLSEEDVKHLEENRQAERQRKEQERLAELESNRIKAEEEAKARREKEERQKRFEQTIAEVKQLEDAGQYEEALRNFKDVSEQYPDFKQNEIDVPWLKGKVELLQAERKEKEEEKRREQERQQAQKEKVEGGLSKLLNEKYELGPNVGTYKVASFKTCVQKVLSWMKAAAVTELPTDQQNALLETIKRLMASPDKKEKIKWDDFNSPAWQQVSKFVGPETAQQWFNDMI